MKKFLAIFMLATCSLWQGGAALAQGAGADDSLYKAFGGKAGLTALVDDFVNRLFVEPRIGTMFKDTKPSNLKEQLTGQLCQLSGGPCKYEGDTMKASHASLGVTRADFNTLVEVLQFAMDAKDIPFRDQNRMLALLAPMHRDIITK